MCNTNVHILCWFNDRLTLDRNNNLSYVNGIVKSILVRKSITRRELIEKVYRIIKINPNEHQFHLTCKWPIAHGKYQAVRILDDDDCRDMFELCAREEHTIELYIEKVL